MGWHDVLAARSAELGKTEADFRAGARRKAYATCLLLLVAGVVGYFIGGAWALVPGIVAAWTAFQCMSATMIANRLHRREAFSAKDIQPPH